MADKLSISWFDGKFVARIDEKELTDNIQTPAKTFFSEGITKNATLADHIPLIASQYAVIRESGSSGGQGGGSGLVQVNELYLMLFEGISTIDLMNNIPKPDVIKAMSLCRYGLNGTERAQVSESTFGVCKVLGVETRDGYQAFKIQFGEVIETYKKDGINAFSFSVLTDKAPEVKPEIK